MAQTAKKSPGLNEGGPAVEMKSSSGQSTNPETDVMAAWALPGIGSTSTFTRCPGNTYKYQRTQYLIRPAELAASGFPSGYTIDAIGFLVASAGGTTQTGNFKVYLRNTNDVTYSLGSTWTTAGFTLVSDIASWTVPIAEGPYVVDFSGGSPFTYTGGGVYVAWEFSNPGTAGTGALVANCNTNLTNGLYGQRSAVSLPTTLAASSWRPATLFANNSLTDIFSVTNIYAQEKCPVPAGVPTNLSARVVNVSTSAETFNVTMTITDQGTSSVKYTNTQTVTALAGGAAAIVNFTPWSANIPENYDITVTIPAGPGENFMTNNTMAIPMNINFSLFGYCYTLNPSTGYGFGTGAGIFAGKFHMNGNGTVTGANLFVYNYPTNSGNSIYAVVLNSAGTIVAQSDPLVIAEDDLGTNKNFTFPTPPAFTDEGFFIGLAQVAGGASSWYPMGCMSESPYRANTFYTVPITGGTPSLLGTDYKFMIEAVVAPTIPTLTEWALIFLGVFLLGTGAFYIMRKRQTSLGV
ncbi:MAG: hypothetical protein Q8M08_00785 [Bacteroidales bacterium]|nr:hypothetical protein [Bacteroidales bacterium]